MLIHTFLVLGWLLSWSMGTVPAVKNVLEAKHFFRRLRTDRKFLQSTCERLKVELRPGDDLVLRRQLATLEALLTRNKTAHHKGMARVACTGVAAAIGTFLTGGAAGVELLADAWPVAEQIAEWGLRIGAPFMGVFATGASADQVHRMVKALSAGGAVQRASAAYACHDGPVDIAALLNHRRREVFWQSAAFSASLMGMGVGIQLIAFWGPTGVWPLVPGVIGMCLTSYTEHENICYRRPLSAEAATALDSTAALTHCLTFTQLDYQLLKGLKHTKRATYPWAGQAPLLLGAWPRGIQWATRHARAAFSRGAPAPLPSAQSTVLGYLATRLLLELQYQSHIETLLSNDLQQTTSQHEAIDTRLVQVRERQRELHAAMPAAKAAATAGDELPPAEALPPLFNFLREQKLLVALGNKVMNGARLEDGSPLREQLGIDQVLDPAAILAHLSEDTPAHRRCTQALFTVAQDILLNTFKAWQHSRARELCDLLLERPSVAAEAAALRTVIVEGALN